MQDNVDSFMENPPSAEVVSAQSSLFDDDDGAAMFGFDPGLDGVQVRVCAENQLAICSPGVVADLPVIHCRGRNPSYGTAAFLLMGALSWWAAGIGACASEFCVVAARVLALATDFTLWCWQRFIRENHRLAFSGCREPLCNSC
ncbi:hypothetical protein CVV68_03715 [Arthrobacter livingstonensis]|uniref:Uncharacterized protein n=1 Tax=Arthrobacter livingstonensis TaxID=670078 RepID=A0A2V5LC30_9MICC|nr:hypothetical protein CVV68_03715 [Arthrobacter livingstonensis]